MNFFDLNDYVKLIIAKHCTRDYFISTIFCLNIKTFKKIYLDRFVFDNDFRTIKKIQHDVKNNDDFNNGKIYKIYKDINDVISHTYVCMYVCIIYTG